MTGTGTCEECEDEGATKAGEEEEDDLLLDPRGDCDWDAEEEDGADTGLDTDVVASDDDDCDRETAVFFLDGGGESVSTSSSAESPFDGTVASKPRPLLLSDFFCCL